MSFTENFVVRCTCEDSGHELEVRFRRPSTLPAVVLEVSDKDDPSQSRYETTVPREDVRSLRKWLDSLEM